MPREAVEYYKTLLGVPVKQRGQKRKLGDMPRLEWDIGGGGAPLALGDRRAPPPQHAQQPILAIADALHGEDDDGIAIDGEDEDADRQGDAHDDAHDGAADEASDVMEGDPQGPEQGDGSGGEGSEARDAAEDSGVEQDVANSSSSSSSSSGSSSSTRRGPPQRDDGDGSVVVSDQRRARAGPARERVAGAAPAVDAVPDEGEFPAGLRRSTDSSYTYDWQDPNGHDHKLVVRKPSSTQPFGGWFAICGFHPAENKNKCTRTTKCTRHEQLLNTPAGFECDEVDTSIVDSLQLWLSLCVECGPERGPHMALPK